MTTTAPAQGTEEIQDAGHVDVLIVGAGVSGIGAAYHLRDQFPTGRSSSWTPRTTGRNVVDPSVPGGALGQ